MADEQAKARVFVNAQQKVMAEQRAVWVQQFMMETAQKLYVQLVLAGGVSDDPEVSRKCAKQANDLAVEFGLAMGLITRQEEPSS